MGLLYIVMVKYRHFTEYDAVSFISNKNALGAVPFEALKAVGIWAANVDCCGLRFAGRPFSNVLFGFGALQSFVH